MQPGALLDGGAAASARNRKHSLRKREKDVLTDMVRAAVPLDANGQPLMLDGAPASAGVFGGSAGFSPDSAPSSSSAMGAPSTVWRLLIFDDVGRDVIAPLLKVGDLRELGVTLYMHIKTERDAVPGAPAIYFCEPSEENIRMISQDCQNSLYEWVYINFTAQVPRPQLELLAQSLVSAGLPSVNHIRVYDRTLSYMALGDDLFTLELPKSFLTLNKQNVQEWEVDQHLNAVVLGLSHVLLSLQALPIIAHSKTGAAEEVARRLSRRLSDALDERQLNPVPSATFGRPLLLLVDRSSDLATALHHPFTYRGLLVDVGGMKLNRCHVHTPDGKDEVLEVDPERDIFYEQNAAFEFGTLSGKIQDALRQYKTDYDALAQSSTVMEDGESDANAMSKLLASAPLLSERKRFLDAHIKVAHSFSSTITERMLSHFHGVELAPLRHDELDMDEFEKLIREGCGTVQDRQRLYLIAYLMCTQRESEAQLVQRLAPIITEGGFPALAYLKQLRHWSLSTRGAGGATSSTDHNAGQGFGWGFAQQIAKNIANTLGSQSAEDLPLTKLVEALLQDAPPGSGGAAGAVGGGTGGSAGGSSSGANALRHKLVDTVSAYDPRTRKAVDLHSARFSQVIVFAIGGGCVAEYDDLKRWEAAHPRKAVAYGCTSVTTGEDMLAQLSALGAEL